MAGERKERIDSNFADEVEGKENARRDVFQKKEPREPEAKNPTRRSLSSSSGQRVEEEEEEKEGRYCCCCWRWGCWWRGKSKQTSREKKRQGREQTTPLTMKRRRRRRRRREQRRVQRKKKKKRNVLSVHVHREQSVAGRKRETYSSHFAERKRRYRDHSYHCSDPPNSVPQHRDNSNGTRDSKLNERKKNEEHWTCARKNPLSRRAQ